MDQENARPAVRSALRPPRGVVAVHAPSRGRVEVLRSGQPGMEAGLAAPGHGWPMAAGPRSRTGARACRAWARHRTKGARALWLLWGFSKVTRCKSETLGGRYRRNGYVHHPHNPRRLTKSIREQARSHNLIGAHLQETGRLPGRLREQARSHRDCAHAENGSGERAPRSQVGSQAASRCGCGARPLERPSGGSA